MNFNRSEIDAIIVILEDNEDFIIENYNKKEDLIAIDTPLKNKIFNSLHGNEKSNKELVRYTIIEAFELDIKDIVVIQEDKIIIKFMDDNSTVEIQEEETGTIASRYNGINENDLKSFYDDIFLTEEHEYFFDNVAEIFVRTHLLAKNINNKNYEENVFGIIQTIISNKLNSSFDSNKGFIKGFSGYIFRIHFKEVFDYISELMLIELSKSNSYIMEFLKYYSLRIVILNGKKYKVPEIIETNGFKWNVASLMPVIKIYIKAAQIYDELDSKIQYINKKIKTHYIFNATPVAFNINLNTKIKQLTQNISEDAVKLDRHIAILKDKTNDSKLKGQIKDIRKNLQHMRDKKTSLTDKLLPKETVTKYMELKRELDALVRQLKREELTIERNEKQFVSIKEALTKALSSKKKLA